MLSFKVAGKPQALKRHRTFRMGDKNINVDPSKGDKADFLTMALQHQPSTPIDFPVKVTILCYFQRPKSHYGTGKNSKVLKLKAPVWHTSVPDADNLGKFVCDSLNGIFWKDDSFVSSLLVVKLYSDDPSVYVSVERLRIEEFVKEDVDDKPTDEQLGLF
jgi:Holliday junction resolvase RusA-like endonuclease